MRAKRIILHESTSPDIGDYAVFSDTNIVSQMFRKMSIDVFDYS